MTFAPAPLPRRAPRGNRLTLAAVLVLLLVGAVVLVLVEREVFTTSSGTAGTQGSGVAATQTRVLAPFDAVELAGSNVVIVHVGAGQSVVVHADDNLVDRVTTRVETADLMIGNAPGSYTTRSPMRVDVTVPSLTSLTLTGSGTMSADGVHASRLRVILSGSGVVRASGATGRLEVSLSGSGDAQLEQLVARDVDAVVSGSGRIVVRPTTSLHAEVPGSGAILYVGNPPQVVTSVTGSGVVTHG